MWHVDWHHLNNGFYLIAFLDDASRRVFSLEYQLIRVENSVDAFKKAIENMANQKEF